MVQCSLYTLSTILGTQARHVVTQHVWFCLVCCTNQAAIGLASCDSAKSASA